MTKPVIQNSRTVPPGPKGRLLVGNAFDFSRGNWLDFFIRCAREYGDVVSLRVLNVPICLLTHPDDIENVLVKNASNFVKSRNYGALKPILGNGLLTSEGVFWQKQRKLVQPSFRHESIAAYAEVMVGTTEQMLSGWRDGQTRDLHEEMVGLTLEIVAKSLFGADVSQETDKVGRAMHDITNRLLAMPNLSFFLPKGFPLPSSVRLRRAVRELDGIIYSMIRARRTESHRSHDLLQMLLEIQDEDGSHLTDEQLRDEMMTLFIAGHETTAIALSWTWYLLAQHPEVEARLVDEVSSLLHGRVPWVSDLRSLPFTEMVLKETMRLYPPAWVVGREALNDFHTRGYRIPAGTNVLLVQWITQRDARFYTEAERFNPDRWKDDPIQSGRLPRYAYFPFGSGPRVCIGAGFAMMEATLLLATIAQRFRLTLASDQPVEMLPSISLRPRNGIKMMLHERCRAM
ncbi:MAG TPA: cytochrome P450 [Candidatus Dormibacteraeota bacterium]|nr:cytochrome P450 [Candidatus Dormibacteraeota bacterium]